VLDHLHLESEIGPYEAADANAGQVRNTYQSLARLLGCEPDEIAVSESGTRAWDMAFYAIRFNPGDRILTSAAEYGSNYIAYLQVAQRTGAIVEVLPNDEHGQVSLDALNTALRRGRVALVGLTHVPATGGLVNPVEEVGQLTRAAGVPFLLNACQSVGQLPLDVERLGCDMLSGAGRKFLRGPRGTGFLYVRRSLLDSLEPPLLDLQAARLDTRQRYVLEPTAQRFEGWERNIAALIGLGVAVDYALARGVATIGERVTAMAERMRTSLAALDGVAVHDLGRTKCGLVSFTVHGQDPVAVQLALRARAINVGALGRRSTPLDFEDRGLDLVVRASAHYYNTDEEIHRLVDAVRDLAGRP
jgi:selenocysteine lyase/cysteine desulfurase